MEGTTSVGSRTEGKVTPALSTAGSTWLVKEVPNPVGNSGGPRPSLSLHQWRRWEWVPLPLPRSTRLGGRVATYPTAVNLTHLRL